MDTDYLSEEAYKGILIEAERFHHNLTLHFGLLARDCANEEEFLDAADNMINKLKKAKPHHIKDFLFGEVTDLNELPATLENIQANIARVREIPKEDRMTTTYSQRYDEHYLNSLIDKATPNWSGIKDKSAWLRQIRGDH
jgi:hypothetical protein